MAGRCFQARLLGLLLLLASLVGSAVGSAPGHPIEPGEGTWAPYVPGWMEPGPRGRVATTGDKLPVLLRPRRRLLLPLRPATLNLPLPLRPSRARPRRLLDLGRQQLDGG